MSIIPYNQGISLYSAETGAIFAQREFIESYEPGDKRIEEKQFYYRTFTLEAIWWERRHELSYENVTWFDMIRLRKAFNVETLQFEDYVGHTFVYGPTLTERELLFPIPTNEIRNNEKLTQNPGY